VHEQDCKCRDAHRRLLPLKRDGSRPAESEVPVVVCSALRTIRLLMGCSKLGSPFSEEDMSREFVEDQVKEDVVLINNLGGKFLFLFLGILAAEISLRR
jgi:hypothetical protein